jgi:hypothetical protein
MINFIQRAREEPDDILARATAAAAAAATAAENFAKPRPCLVEVAASGFRSAGVTGSTWLHVTSSYLRAILRMSKDELR